MKNIFLLFGVLLVICPAMLRSQSDPFAGFDVPLPEAAKPAAESKQPFSGFELPGETPKKRPAMADPFSGFELPGETPKKQVTPFSGFELPGETPKKDSLMPASRPAKPGTADPFKMFEVLPTDQPAQKTGTTADSAPAIAVVQAGDWWEKVEKSGEDVLFYANVYNLYYQGKKWLKPAPVAPVSASTAVLPAAQTTVDRPPDAGQEKAWIEQLEKQILQNKVRALPSRNDLEQITIESVPDTSEITAKIGELPPLAVTKVPEINAAVMPEEDKPGIPWIKFAFAQEFTVFELRDSWFNPDNYLHFVHYLHRSLLLTTISCPLYDNQDPQRPFLISLYVKDTYVYSDQVYPLSQEFSKNYLQEAYLSMQYERLGLTVGKINLRPGDGGGLAWNPTDYFDFYTELYHPRDGNFQRRGVRSGLWAAQASYSFPFGTLSFAYAPDLTDDGDVHENTEYNNNRENIYFVKFNWILFDQGGLVGPLGHTLVPASPDFFFSYFDRQHQVNVGFVWSIGVGNNMLLRFESNYSRKTEMEEIEELPPLGPYRQFAFRQRDGDDWLSVVSLLYTWHEFNLDAEYLFHYNGWSRSEWDSYGSRVRYLRDNYRDPAFGGQYSGLLAQSAGYDSLSWGRHYLFLRLSRTFLVEPKKRSLQVNVAWLANLQDWSGSIGCGLSYQFFTYAKLELAYSTVLARHTTILGETPIDSMASFALELLF